MIPQNLFNGLNAIHWSEANPEDHERWDLLCTVSCDEWDEKQLKTAIKLLTKYKHDLPVRTGGYGLYHILHANKILVPFKFDVGEPDPIWGTSQNSIPSVKGLHIYNGSDVTGPDIEEPLPSIGLFEPFTRGLVVSMPDPDEDDENGAKAE